MVWALWVHDSWGFRLFRGSGKGSTCVVGHAVAKSPARTSSVSAAVCGTCNVHVVGARVAIVCSLAPTDPCSKPAQGQRERDASAAMDGDETPAE
eukprot:1321276-Rhodomonas_salina.4